MYKYFKLILFFIVSIVFIISLYGIFSKAKVISDVPTDKEESFEPHLTEINSIEKLLIVSDSLYQNNYGLTFDTSKYVDVLGNLVEKRFRKGLAVYTFEGNWIASLLGKFVWSHFSAIVKPDDILKSDEGLCSQQTMVFMEALRIKGIPFRSVGLGYDEGPGHFLCEVNYNGDWHLYDVTLEPIWESSNSGAQSLDYYRRNINEMYKAYNSIIPQESIDTLMKRIKYGRQNEFPASNMLIFHRFTFVLIWLMPFVSGLIMFLLYKRIKNGN